jgi:hypothetical protein
MEKNSKCHLPVCSECNTILGSLTFCNVVDLEALNAHYCTQDHCQRDELYWKKKNYQFLSNSVYLFNYLFTFTGVENLK